MIGSISVRFSMVIGLAVLSDCAPGHLHNSETGKTVQCGSYFEDPALDHSGRLLKRACIEDYERQGYHEISGG